MGELKYLDLHGDRIAYRDVGSGETLLLIHGMAGSSETWRLLVGRVRRMAA
jgi:pimeloyl-ACP methyl ester carboxylesterase